MAAKFILRQRRKQHNEARGRAEWGPWSQIHQPTDDLSELVGVVDKIKLSGDKEQLSGMQTAIFHRGQIVRWWEGPSWTELTSRSKLPEEVQEAKIGDEGPYGLFDFVNMLTGDVCAMCSARDEDTARRMLRNSVCVAVDFDGDVHGSRGWDLSKICLKRLRDAHPMNHWVRIDSGQAPQPGSEG